jgi:hypothetical protein
MLKTTDPTSSPQVFTPARPFMDRNLFTLLVILWATLGGTLFLVLQQNQSHFVYALDDPYIHMAVAKNLAGHGVWGITPYEFSSASSSLLWTGVLALIFFITGPQEIVPLLLNLVAASALLIMCYKLLERYEVAGRYKVLAGLGLIFLTPLPALVFVGMEHTVQTLLVIGFVTLSARLLCLDKIDLRQSQVRLWLGLAPLLTLVRYEGLFVVGVVGLLLLLRRHYLSALIMGGLAALPVLVFGFISVQNGSEWLPNSVLIKGHAPHVGLLELFQLLGYLAMQQVGPPLIEVPQLLIPAVIALLLFVIRYNRKGFWEYHQLGLLIFPAVAFLHVQFAGIGWFYRYEAYLIALGLMVVTAALFDTYGEKLQGASLKLNHLPKYAVLLLLVFLLVQPLSDRGLRGLIQTPTASNDIYSQQYQMGLFLKEYYPGATLAANDVGVINYMNDLRCLDLMGLGSIEVARLYRSGQYASENLVGLSLAHHVKIAVIYDEVVNGTFDTIIREDDQEKPGRNRALEAGWVKVAEWKIPTSPFVGRSTVSFYAVDPAEAPRLQTSLEQFSAKLPPRVQSRILTQIAARS